CSLVFLARSVGVTGAPSAIALYSPRRSPSRMLAPDNDTPRSFTSFPTSAFSFSGFGSRMTLFLVAVVGFQVGSDRMCAADVVQDRDGALSPLAMLSAPPETGTPTAG